MCLIDPVELHIRQAQDASKKSGIQLSSFHQADARELPFDDAEFDIALLLGPLYHLIEEPERERALREAHRILKPDGLIFAAAISRYGSIVDGFFLNRISDRRFAEIMKNDMTSGIHLNEDRSPGYFTTAFFHKPNQLKKEMKAAGFKKVGILAVESVFSYIPDLDSRWENESYRSLLLDTLRAMEADQTIVGLGGHIIGVGTKRH